MKLAIMQPYFFPYLGYFQLINSVDKFILYDDVNYIKKGWINRNFILLNKEKYLLTTPLVNSSQNKLICDTLISNQSKWKEKMLATISQAYKKAAQFNDVFPIFEEIFIEDFKTISEFNKFSIEKICKYLKIETKIEFSSDKSLSKNLKGEERIMNLCKYEKASVYINPIGGVMFYDKEKFEMNGIKLFFVKSTTVAYYQFNQPFVPGLSIIDVLMFNSVDQIKEILKQYQLV